MAQLDWTQLAALRRLRAAFGPIVILEVLDHRNDQDQPAAHRDGADQEGGEPPPSAGP